MDGSGALIFRVTEPAPALVLEIVGASGVGVLLMTYFSSPIFDTLFAASKATNFRSVSTLTGIGPSYRVAVGSRTSPTTGSAPLVV